MDIEMRKAERLSVKAGNIVIGGGAPISVQSMTNTDTHNYDATYTQIKRLEAAGREVSFELASDYIGKQRDVLFELCEDGRATGHTPEFLEVAVITNDDLHGETKKVKLYGFDGTVFSGFII